MKSVLFKANLAIFFAELFNALNVNAQKYLLPEWSSPFAMLLIRTGFGALLFWGLSLFIHEKKVQKQDLLLMFGGGAVALTAYITFYLLGVMKSSPVDSSLIMSTMPLVVLMLAIFFFHEHLTKLKGIGVFMGVAGTVTIILMQTSSSGSADTLIGNIYCLLSAIAYGFYLIVNKLLTGKYAAATILKWMFSGAFILSIPLTFVFGWDLPVFHHPVAWKPVGVIIFVLLFPTGLTYFLIPYALKHLQASTVAMYDYEVPIVASFVGIMIGQAHFAWYQPLATLLIFSGVYLVSRENRRLKKKYHIA